MGVGNNAVEIDLNTNQRFEDLNTDVKRLCLVDFCHVHGGALGMRCFRFKSYLSLDNSVFRPSLNRQLNKEAFKFADGPAAGRRTYVFDQRCGAKDCKVL
jgi:hypothetical protein